MTETLNLEQLRRDVVAAEEKLAAAKAQLDEARSIEWHERQERSLKASVVIDMIDPDPKYRGEASYILPLGKDYEGCNPLDPTTSPFGQGWLAYSSAVILSKPERTRPTRIVFSSGYENGDWRVGNTWTCRHDQTGAKLGTYTVVGLVYYDGEGNVMRTAGDVPNRRLNGAVFK